MNPTDTLRFVEGFALGLNADIKQEEITSTDAQFIDTLHDAYSEMSEGFKNWSITKIEEGIATFAKAMQQMGVFIKQAEILEHHLCEAINKLCEDLKTWTGVLMVTKEEAIAIWHHRDEEGVGRWRGSIEEGWVMAGREEGRRETNLDYDSNWIEVGIRVEISIWIGIQIGI